MHAVTRVFDAGGNLPRAKAIQVRCAEGFWERTYTLEYVRRSSSAALFEEKAERCPGFAEATPATEVGVFIARLVYGKEAETDEMCQAANRARRFLE